MAAEYDLDVLGNKPQLSLPTHSREGGVAASNLAGAPAASSRGLLSSRHAKERSGKSAVAKQGANSSGGGGGELSEGVREKLATVLAKEFSRKVRAQRFNFRSGSRGWGALTHAKVFSRKVPVQQWPPCRTAKL